MSTPLRNFSMQSLGLVLNNLVGILFSRTLDPISEVLTRRSSGDRKVVDFDAIEHAAKTIYSEGSVLPLTSTSAISTEEVGARLDIVNAFDVPNYSFSTGNTAAERRAFSRSTDVNITWNLLTFLCQMFCRSKNSSSSPLGTATAKAALCRERYELIRQRLLRNELFRPDSSFSNRNVSDEQDNVFKVAIRTREDN